MLLAVRRDERLIRMLDGAWYDGRQAAEAGREDDANPHEPTSLFGVAWVAGWYTTWRSRAAKNA